MDERTIQILFTLISSAISGTKLKDEEREEYSEQQLNDLLDISRKHDVEHLFVLGLKQNSLISKDDSETEKKIVRAIYRFQRLDYEYSQLCTALENSKIPFIPLKGSVLRKFYPEPWMRTSCDIDVLVRGEELDEAFFCLTNTLKYTKKQRATHDVLFITPSGNSVELHFDLVEEGRANSAIDVLSSVWETVSLHEDSEYRYDMSDEFFYFYHVAHMAKHFENGGCGIRPFIDLWILDKIDGANHTLRDELLDKANLLQFANVCRKLSKAWFDGEEKDDLSLQMQDFLLKGGIYGTADNRVSIQQKKRGGKVGYLLSRVFAPYEKLKRYYPILEKYPILTPVMHIRRWLMIFRPDVYKMAKNEINKNFSFEKEKSEEMKTFLDRIGL